MRRLGIGALAAAAAQAANLVVPGQATLLTIGGRQCDAYRCPP